MKLYAEISKTEEVADGTLRVYGYASSGAVDSDGETITPAAMKAALPDYMKWGAVREMHQPKAAGTAIEARVDDDGLTHFAAHIVDSEAVKKVKSGVYKGFSIGGQVTGRDGLSKTTITGLKLVEVSLVDRPANPEAVLTCFKAEAGLSGDTLGDMRGETAADEPPPDAVVAKAGARFSTTTKAALKAAHDACRAADKALAELGYDGDGDAGGDGPPAGDGSQKAEMPAGKPDADSELAKALDAIKAVRADLAKAAKERDEAIAKAAGQARRIAELEAQPEPPKGALKTFGKAQDSGAAEAPPPANPREAILKAHTTGGFRLM